MLPPEFGENLRTHRGRCRTRDNGRTVRLVAADSENGFDSLPPKPCTLRLLSAAFCCLLFFRHCLSLMVAHGKGFVKVFGEKSRGLTAGAPRRIIISDSLFRYFCNLFFLQPDLHVQCPIIKAQQRKRGLTNDPKNHSYK